jgi:hypothetical protein
MFQGPNENRYPDPFVLATVVSFQIEQSVSRASARNRGDEVNEMIEARQDPEVRGRPGTIGMTGRTQLG